MLVAPVVARQHFLGELALRFLDERFDAAVRRQRDDRAVRGVDAGGAPVLVAAMVAEEDDVSLVKAQRYSQPISRSVAWVSDLGSFGPSIGATHKLRPPSNGARSERCLPSGLILTLRYSGFS